tara:strand:- start:2783 stop:3610 length:828 start_codon:yes stop_codon:yes gene_type:complete
VRHDKQKKATSFIGIRMKNLPLGPAVAALLLSFAAPITVPLASAQTLDEVLGVRSATTESGRKSQLKVDQLSEDTRDLLTQYKQVMKIVDGLKVYNLQQERLIAKQEEEMSELNLSIDQVSLIERQIGPLIERMIQNLEVFIEKDIPFLMEERRERVVFLKDMMDRADVSVSEKFNQVLQAYQVENTFGTTIEPYSDLIEFEGKQRQVDMLKFGRVALVFQTPDGEITGVWNNDSRNWERLPDSYRAEVRDGLRMARKTKTPDLVRLPVVAPRSN